MTPSQSLPPFSRGVPKILEALRPGQRGARDHYVVCGANALTYRLVEELSQRYAAAVTVIMTERQRRTGRDFTELPGVRVLAAERLDDKVFLAAGLSHAAGLALTEQDDVGNIHAAMRAEELNGRLRIVVRVFNLSLGMRVRQLFRDCAVISDSAIAVPAFVQAALGDGAPAYFRFAGRTLYATHRTEVAERDVVCGLSRTAPDGTPEVLPFDHGSADVVLAVAHGEKSVDGRVRRRRRRSWTFGALLRFLRGGMSRGLRIGLAVTFAVLVAGGISLTLANHESAWAGVYETLLTAFSGADASKSVWTQVSQLVVTVSGMALVPLITAVVVEGLVNAKLAFTSGRVLDHYEDHVVVVGLGNVGTRIIRSLRDLGVPVIAIDKSEDARGVAIARELEIPLVIGDASREETLRRASVQSCRALVIVSTDDVVNLETALNGRALRPGLKIVMRLFDSDLAERIQQTFSIATTRSVSAIAAPAFAAALMEREVLATIPIGRRVLLVADVVVAPGSSLDGEPVTAATIDGLARVIAVGGLGEPRPRWSPPDDQVLVAHDRVTVVVTRAGLSRLLRLAATDATGPIPAGPSR
ncbi:NAD-binding protein [Hamadaea tsunoensis]|uniref:NAD-binding protein n=1 Tax=Hamadaea tsunoensis TaxID=53368 RepID=UPI0004162442|nr:NAD-binding protein [Hamadaea tsunoensis]